MVRMYSTQSNIFSDPITSVILSNGDFFKTSFNVGLPGKHCRNLIVIIIINFKSDFKPHEACASQQREYAYILNDAPVLNVIFL